jgi:hypothetical protein
MGLDHVSTRLCWDINLIERLIIVMYAPIDEWIGCWNMLKNNTEVECVAVKITK